MTHTPISPHVNTWWEDWQGLLSSRYMHQQFSQLQEEVGMLKANLVKYKVATIFVVISSQPVVALQVFENLF